MTTRKKPAQKTVSDFLQGDDAIMWFRKDGVEIFLSDTQDNDNTKTALLLWYAITRPALMVEVLKIIGSEYTMELELMRAEKMNEQDNKEIVDIEEEQE